MNGIVSTYLDTWNATDARERARLLEANWSASARYVDPLAEVSGTDQIAGLIGGVHDQFPGFVFTLVGEPDAHHDQVRFQWGLGPAGAEPVVVGFDVMTLDEEGRIDRVLGFLDRVPA